LIPSLLLVSLILQIEYTNAQKKQNAILVNLKSLLTWTKDMTAEAQEMTNMAPP